MTDLTLDSLQRRMAAMHSLYYQAVDTMGLEHVNHFEREGVLPIAFSLFHYTNMEDASFMMITGIPPIWNDEWQEKVQVSINDHGKHRSVEEMVPSASATSRRSRATSGRCSTGPRTGSPTSTPPSSPGW